MGGRSFVRSLLLLVGVGPHPVLSERGLLGKSTAEARGSRPSEWIGNAGRSLVWSEPPRPFFDVILLADLDARST